MRVDDDALMLIFRDHDKLGRKARAFDVKLQPVAAHITDGRAAHAARALRPAAVDLVLAVDGELAAEVEIVAVAGTANIELEIPLVAEHVVGCPASDRLTPAVRQVN